MVRVVEIEGRPSPRATQVARADDQYGGMVTRPTGLTQAPVDAFGDPSGKLAIANGLMNAGNAFFDVAKRDLALQRAEGDSAYGAAKSGLALDEERHRREIKEEKLTINRTPDEMLAEYDRRMDESYEKWFGGTEFKFINQSFIDRDIGQFREGTRGAYLSKPIADERLDRIRADTRTSLDALVSSAAAAGQARSQEQLNAVIHSIKEIIANPRTGAAFTVAGAVELEAKFVTDAIVSFVREIAEIDPEGALNLIDDPDSPIRELINEEDLMAIREDLQGRARAEIAEKDAMLSRFQGKNYGSMLLRIYEPDPDTGKSTTRIAVIQSQRRGEIDDEQTVRLIRAIEAHEDRLLREAEQRKESFSLVTWSLAIGGTMSDVPGAQRDVDTWDQAGWMNFLEGLQTETDPDVRARMAMEYTERLHADIVQLGVLPSRELARIQGGLRSTVPGEAEASARDVITLLDANPRLLDQFPPATASMALLVDSGVDPGSARDVMAHQSQMKEEEKAGLRERANEKFPSNKEVERHIRSTTGFRNLIGRNPEIPANASREWRNLYEQYFLYYQDHDAATKHADWVWNKKWGVGDFDGTGNRMIIGNPNALHSRSREILEIEMDEWFNLKEGEYQLVFNADPNNSTLEAPTYWVYDLRGPVPARLVYPPDDDGRVQPYLFDLTGEENKTRGTQMLIDRGLQERADQAEGQPPRAKVGRNRNVSGYEINPQETVVGALETAMESRRRAKQARDISGMTPEEAEEFINRPPAPDRRSRRGGR